MMGQMMLRNLPLEVGAERRLTMSRILTTPTNPCQTLTPLTLGGRAEVMEVSPAALAVEKVKPAHITFEHYSSPGGKSGADDGPDDVEKPSVRGGGGEEIDDVPHPDDSEAVSEGTKPGIGITLMSL
jgi:hypothetical protein